MSAIDKLVVSRQKSIVKLDAEIAELEAQAAPLVAGSPARVALGNVVAVKKARRAMLAVELDGFRSLAVDSRQLEVPGAKKK